MDSNEQTFIKGFNAGYQMRKHDPALIERLCSDGKAKGEYFRAMELGKRAFERERVLDILKASKGRDRHKEQER